MGSGKGDPTSYREAGFSRLVRTLPGNVRAPGRRITSNSSDEVYELGFLRKE